MPVQIKGVGSISGLDQGIVVGIATATNFKSGTSNVHSTGYECTNVNATGVITATSFSGSGANLTGITVPGGGTGLDLNDNAKIRLGTGNDLEIVHNGSKSLIRGTTATNIDIKTAADFFVTHADTDGSNGENCIVVRGDGEVELYHDGTKKLATAGHGINITGGFVATGDCSIADKITHAGDENTSIRFPNNDAISFETAGGQRLRIYDDGYVIIGSTSKSSTAGAGGLDIQGNSTNCILEMGNPFPSFSGGVVPEFRITATNSSHTVDFESVWGGDNNLHKHLAFSGGATVIYQGTSNTEVARFTGEGLVVGSTTFSNAHNTDPGACVFENGQVMCRRDNTMFTAKSIATGGQNAFRVLSAQTQVGSIYFNSGGTSFNTSSDYRRKENVIDLTGAITRLKTLKPKRFNFISNPAVTLDGFLAHEVTAVPEAVTGIKDEVATEDGEDYKKGDPIYQQLDQSKLVPLLVAALQEAVARIEALEGS